MATTRMPQWQFRKMKSDTELELGAVGIYVWRDSDRTVDQHGRDRHTAMRLGTWRARPQRTCGFDVSSYAGPWHHLRGPLCIRLAHVYCFRVPHCKAGRTPCEPFDRGKARLEFACE